MESIERPEYIELTFENGAGLFRTDQIEMVVNYDDQAGTLVLIAGEKKCRHVKESMRWISTALGAKREGERSSIYADKFSL